MIAKAVNPGNLHVRLGAVLQKYEDAVFNGDMETASGMLGIVATYCSVHMEPKERQALESMPGFAYGDSRRPWEVFRDMNARLAYILEVVKQHGVFTRADSIIGDASSLDQEPEAVEA